MKSCGDCLIRENEGTLSLMSEGLASLWEQTLGDPGVTIAVLDGPCDLTHPCFAGASIRQLDFIGAEGSVNGLAGEHGTHVASVIFGQHGGPVKGIAPRCQGLLVPIFREGPLGTISRCTQPDLARAIRASANSGANIINVSAGQFSHSGTAHPMLADAIEECRKQGRLIISAAGNDGCACLHVPGALPSVLAVGAMDAEGNPMEFSNWGSNYQFSGVLAPGVNILGALPRNRVAMRTGTSFAAPIVSGIAGLLLSLQKQRNTGPNVQAIRAAILDTAIGCQEREVPDCRRLLAGRLSVNRAVAAIVGDFQSTAGKIKSQNKNQGETMSQPTNSTVSPVPVPQTVGATDPSQRGASNTDVQVSEQERPTLPAPDSNLRQLQPAGSADGGVVPQHLPASSRSVAPVNGRPKIQEASTESVCASDCSCQHNGEMVYAIGGLTVDFGTLARLDSIQQNMDLFKGGPKLNARVHSHLLRHLLGWKETYRPPGEQEDKTVFHEAALYDAKDIIWVLTQDESPLYAIKPAGTYAEDGYFELAHFFMEHEGYDEAYEMLPADYKGRGPNNLWYHPSLDTVDGKDANLTTRKDGTRERIVDRVAIPGRISGSVKLLNGMVIPVITPNQRGTCSWKLETLIRLRCGFDPKAKGEESKKQLQTIREMERISRRFFEDARNKGLSGADRARNFAATQSFSVVPDLRAEFEWDEEAKIELDSITVQPSPTCRVDSECYDVDVSFFDPDNVLRSKMVRRSTVDVSDEVPVLLGKPRVIRTR